MDAIAATCHTDYMPASKTSGTRPLDAIRLLVLHSTEGGGSAKNVAEFFHGPSAEGSAHLVVDDDACYRCLANEQIPWAAPSANTDGFHIEQVGYAAWTAAEWEKHLNMLHRTAYKLAYHSKLFGIPLVFVDAAGLRAGHKGVTTHAEVSKAYPNSQGNHHDPGTGYPMRLVLNLALHYKKTL